MKRAIFLNLALVFFLTTNAQEVEFKDGMIKVDGKDYLKMEVKKQNFGLTKSFELYSLAGKKIITAAVATEFEKDESDNTYLYYKVKFLTSSQEGIFKISSLSQEKAFAKLIGTSAIIVNDAADDEKVQKFIESKGVTPRVAH